LILLFAYIGAKAAGRLLQTLRNYVVKMMLKAGGESAGDERQRKLLQANTDLAAVFMESDRIQELVSRRTFGSGWVGSHHVYEAGLLSGRSELLGDARSRLRMAREWLRNWSQLPSEEREREKVEDDEADLLADSFVNFQCFETIVDLNDFVPFVSQHFGRVFGNFRLILNQQKQFAITLGILDLDIGGNGRCRRSCFIVLVDCLLLVLLYFA